MKHLFTKNCLKNIINNGIVFRTAINKIINPNSLNENNDFLNECITKNLNIICISEIPLFHLK